MKAFSRIGICMLLCIVLSIFVIGLQVWMDLSSREDDVLTYTRLAVRDALVNIQTTEQNGYDYINAMSPTEYDYTFSSDKYKQYLESLKSQADSDENMKIISSFLISNADDASGNSLFRPIQYGLTYVDPELFVQSFETSLQSLVDANYTNATNYNLAGVSFTTKAPNAVRISSVSYAINGEDNMSAVKPKLGTVSLSSVSRHTDEIYKSIYGIDRIIESDLNKNLGFGSSSINFYVYYDIDITVEWESASTNQLLTKSFFTSLAAFGDRNKVSAGLQYTPSADGSQEYLYIPGKPITYHYRYVLLN